MPISAISVNHKNNPSFAGVKKYTHVILPVASEGIDKLSLNIQDGRFLSVRKTGKHKTAFLDGVGRLTQWFNGDKLVGTLKEFTTGRYYGSRIFKDGTMIEYSTFGDKVGTTIRKNGRYIGHTTGEAYKENGTPNIMTKKEIDEMQRMVKESLKDALSPQKAAEALEAIFEKSTTKS